ncbi:hypothetical protein Tco_1315977 [Tanacetum coccineum]
MDNLALTREEDDEISVALDPQTLSSGFDVSTELEVDSLMGTTLVFRATIHIFNKIKKTHIMDGINSECLTSASQIGFDPQLLVEHFNLVEDNTCLLESDVLDDSTCLMLLEDVRGKD